MGLANGGVNAITAAVGNVIELSTSQLWVTDGIGMMSVDPKTNTWEVTRLGLADTERGTIPSWMTELADNLGLTKKETP